MAGVGLEAVLDELEVQLAGMQAKFARGEDAIGGNDRPPRIIWVYGEIKDAQRAKPIGGGPTTFLQEDAYSLDAHLWGVTRSDCERMRHALISALRRVVKGRNYLDGGARWEPREKNDFGFVLVQSLTIYLLMPDVRITAASAPAQGTYARPTDSVSDATVSTIQVTDVAIDTTAPSPGDGHLDSGEG